MAAPFPIGPETTSTPSPVAIAHDSSVDALSTNHTTSPTPHASSVNLSAWARVDSSLCPTTAKVNVADTRRRYCVPPYAGVIIAVLSPHLDDAVLSAWTVLSGRDPVRVITVCDGVPAAGVRGALDELFGATDSAAFVAQRRLEDDAALATVHVSSQRLGLLDAQYRTGPLPMPDLDRLIGESLDGADLIVAPAAFGDHPDHVAVRDAALRVGAAHQIAVRLYADLPYAARLGWPHFVTGDAPRARLRPEVLWWRSLAPVMNLIDTDPHPVRLSDDAVVRKLAAVHCYESQFDVLTQGPIGLLTHEETLRYECYFDATSSR
jgi:LmbE family N-acetylglucosaminyl deacetylase